MEIKAFVADHFGHFSPYDLPNVIFQVLMAALLGWAFGYFGMRAPADRTRKLAYYAATVALAVSFMRMQLPIGLALLGIFVLVRPRVEQMDGASLLGVLVLGVGCGSGASLVAAIIAIPYIALVRWARPVDRTTDNG